MPQTPCPSLDAYVTSRLTKLEASGLRRALHPTARHEGGGADRNGQRLVSFSDNDYLGLSMDPRVMEAAASAARTYGAGAGAARLVSGDCPLNHELEHLIAAMKAQPAARVFGSGYLANTGTIPVLVGPGDVIVMDELSHACMHAGAALSKAEVRIYPHNDVKAARLMLERPGGARALLLTETVFSMDGDVAPLDDLADVCEDANAWMMTDDAHGFGVVNTSNPAIIQMGTLSKAVGAYGGYVAGPAAFVELLASRARTFIYTTGLPPPVLGAAIAALTIMRAAPDLGEQAIAKARLFCELAGLPAPQSAIVPVILGGAGRVMDASARLAEHGFLVTGIRPPTVPEGTARLRITFSARHEPDSVRSLATVVSEILQEREM